MSQVDNLARGVRKYVEKGYIVKVRPPLQNRQDNLLALQSALFSMVMISGTCMPLYIIIARSHAAAAISC
jgi:hypothetical protein